MKVWKESESEEKKTTVIWELMNDFRPYTAYPLLLPLEDVGGLLLMKFVSKCE